ncbi:MAG: hypothetical protein WBB07_20765 [Mycobacterium sp.]
MTYYPPFVSPHCCVDIPSGPLGRLPLRVRLAARLFAGHLDGQLAMGIIGPPDSAIGLRATHLESVNERQVTARALRRAVIEAREGRATTAATVPVHRRNVAEAEETIDAITLRLHSPHPVNARGMARLRQVLTNGCGPLYTRDGHNLDDQLRAALAML